MTKRERQLTKSYRVEKHYNDMIEKERIEYAQWLRRNNLWDGAMVIDMLQMSKQLKIEGVI